MTCCVKSLQLLRKQIKSNFKPAYKNIIEHKKVLASHQTKEEDGTGNVPDSWIFQNPPLLLRLRTNIQTA